MCQSCRSGWSKKPSGSCFECVEGSNGHLTILVALALLALIAAYCGLSRFLLQKRKKREYEHESAGRLFDCLDTDNSGTISRDELRSGLAQLGVEMSAEQIFALIGNIDMDGNGDIDRDEFEACASIWLGA